MFSVVVFLSHAYLYSLWSHAVSGAFYADGNKTLQTKDHYDFTVNVMIIMGNVTFIYECRFSKKSLFSMFLHDFTYFLSSLKSLQNKECVQTIIIITLENITLSLFT